MAKTTAVTEQELPFVDALYFARDMSLQHNFKAYNFRIPSVL